jgi:hypothetical protein
MSGVFSNGELELVFENGAKMRPSPNPLRPTPNPKKVKVHPHYW